MLNSILATCAVLIWTSSYLLYFQRDLRRWWALRPQRRAEERAARQRAVQAYAAWVRDLPPPRSRRAILPEPVPVHSAPAMPRRTAVVVAFPEPGRSVRPG